MAKHANSPQEYDWLISMTHTIAPKMIDKIANNNINKAEGQVKIKSMCIQVGGHGYLEPMKQ